MLWGDRLSKYLDGAVALWGPFMISQDYVQGQGQFEWEPAANRWFICIARHSWAAVSLFSQQIWNKCRPSAVQLFMFLICCQMFAALLLHVCSFSHTLFQCCSVSVVGNSAVTVLLHCSWTTPQMVLWRTKLLSWPLLLQRISLV